MSFRRDLEDIGLLKLVLDANKTKQILEEIQEARLAEIRQAQYVASVEDRNKIAEQLESIDRRIEELAKQPPSAAEPIRFLLNNLKLNLLAKLYSISQDIISGKDLADAQLAINQQRGTSIVANVSMLPRIFPQNSSALDDKAKATWDRHFTELGLGITTLVLHEDSAEGAVVLLEQMRKIWEFARILPKNELDTTQVSEWISLHTGDYGKNLKVRVASILPMAPTAFDYKRLAKTQAIPVLMYHILLLLGLIAYVHRFCDSKNYQESDIRKIWAEIQMLLGFRCEICGGFLVEEPLSKCRNGRLCPKCKTRVNVAENQIAIPARIVVTGCHGPVVLGGTGLLDYCQKVSVIGIGIFKNCFVATVVFQDANHPVVCQLRVFRNKLEGHAFGRLISRTYWHLGPHLAKIVDYLPSLRNPLRYFLTALVQRLAYRAR